MLIKKRSVILSVIRSQIINALLHTCFILKFDIGKIVHVQTTEFRKQDTLRHITQLVYLFHTKVCRVNVILNSKRVTLTIHTIPSRRIAI